jgi:hypothetical protein
MTQFERDLTLAVIDGRPEPAIMVAMFQISRHTRREEILLHLVRGRIVGREFLAVLRERYDGSILNLMADTVKRIDRDVTRRPIVVGKHYF